MMNIVIIEDEYLLADELEERLMQIQPSLHIVAKLESIEDAVEWFNNNHCDLIFMDIQLSDGLSFSIFERVQVSCPVIFTTAYDQYAIQAFDVNSIAYILKPLEEAEIRKALHKYETLRHSYAKNLQKFISEYTSEKSDYKEQLVLTQGTVRKIVNTQDIACFQADDRYVFAITTQAQRFFCSYTLKELEDNLNPHIFFRINRTFIINKEHIKEWTSHAKGKIKITPKHAISGDLIVSRARITAFRSWLQN